MTPTHPNLRSVACSPQSPLIAPRYGAAALFLFALITGLVACGGVKESSRRQQPDIERAEQGGSGAAKRSGD